MTEQEWLQATDPQAMLKFLKSKVSDRKLRLFAVACCRRVWRLPSESKSRQTFEVAERSADGEATEAELRQAHNAFYASIYMVGEAKSWWGQWVMDFMNKTFPDDHWGNDYPPLPCELAILAAVSRKAVKGANIAVREAVRVPEDFTGDRGIAIAEKASIVCDVLRHLFGNPFRSIALDPAWLSWHDGLLVSMAQKMYDSRDFSDMPVLADALEEAGCQDQDILGHCRSGGEHVRGCWVVDLLLGKE